VKVLVVHPGAHFSVADVYNGLVKGLRANGCEVGVLNLNDRLEFYTRAYVDLDGRMVKAFNNQAAVEMAAKGIEIVCYEWWPDIIVVVSGFYVPPLIWGVLARRPHHVVYWATESPYEDDRQSMPARYVDTVILNDPANLDRFRAELNPNTHYLPHSYDPDVHHPGSVVPNLSSDFAFVGTGFPSRIEFFEQVDWTGLDAVFGGNWHLLEPGSPLMPMLLHEQQACLDNPDTADVYRSTKASVNLYRKEHSEQANADGWAIGPREVELAACGTFFLREPRGEGNELFPRHPTFTDAAEFSDKLRWWLTHPKPRETACVAAQAAIADRTFTDTTARLLRIVEAAGKKIAA
jgi:spore maturation protein CgeB